MIDPLINEKAALAVSLLLKNKKKVACAESCTGGLLSAAITEISGSSSVFDFGAVTYANTMKQRLLGVSAETLAVYGAVSEQTARAMAKGILSYSGADYALSITGIAANISRPCHVIGMHFFNPATVMKLVEIIKGQMTSQEVFDAVFALCQEIGKTPVAVNEAPGFVVNRILIPMVNEAVGILADGVASRDDIDAAMKLGANHPMGPLALADLIGLDVCLAIMEVLHSEFGDDKYRPHPLLRKMVRAGLLGRKTGEGFYKY